VKTYKPLPYEIELHSGLYLDLTKPHQCPFTIRDVAWGLGHNNRYTGQAARAYTVAEHAVLVSWRLEALGYPPEVRLAGLHHDDAEAFLGDVNRALKALLPDYRHLEHRMQNAIVRRLKLPSVERWEAAVVKEADNWALSAEAAYLMPSMGQGWWCEGLYDITDNAQADVVRPIIFRHQFPAVGQMPSMSPYNLFLFEHGRITKEAGYEYDGEVQVGGEPTINEDGDGGDGRRGDHGGPGGPEAQVGVLRGGGRVEAGASPQPDHRDD
jgi:hypothetical protein